MRGIKSIFIKPYIHTRILSIWLLLAVLTFLLSLGSFWILYPYKTIKFEQMPFKIIGPTTIKNGDYISYEVKFTKYTKVVPTQYKQFIDGIIFQVSPENSQPLIINHNSGTAIFRIKVPETLPPGVYHIHTDTYYRMNPIRTIHEETYTNDFTVIPDKDIDKG